MAGQRIYVCSSVNIDYFAFLTECIAHAGYAVEPVTLISEDSYRRRARRRGLAKLWLRVQMYLLYPLLLIWKSVRAPAGSVFVITSNTFYAPALTQVVGRLRRQRVFALIYDLYPDALEVAGKVSPRALAVRVLGLIASANQKLCEATIYLGPFLSEHAAARWGKPRCTTAIDISADSRLFGSGPLRTHPHVELHYGGQLGYMHDADSVVHAVRELMRDPEIAHQLHATFNVSGSQAELLEAELADSPSVAVLPPVPSAQWRERISDCHLGLVSLSPGGATVCLPSKTYAMMAGGLAIVAICPVWSDLAALVEQYEAGWVISNSPYRRREDLAGPAYLERTRARLPAEQVALDFAKTIRMILSDPAELRRRRENARRAMQTELNVDALAAAWERFLNTRGIESTSMLPRSARQALS